MKTVVEVKEKTEKLNKRLAVEGNGEIVVRGGYKD